MAEQDGAPPGAAVSGNPERLTDAEIQALQTWLEPDAPPLSLRAFHSPAGQTIVSGLRSLNVNGADRRDALFNSLHAYFQGEPTLVDAESRRIFAAAPSPAAPPAISVPTLPEEARVNPDLAVGASPWLDAYAAFSAKWSPQSFAGFHPAIGVWLLSMIAARRTVLRLGTGNRYPSLYVALVARSSLYAKTTAARVGIGLARAIAVDWLLAPDDSTPQKFISDMTGKVPGNYDELPPDKQQRIQRRLSRAAQRGWFYDEFGQLLSSLVREGGHMTEFRGILRRMDDGSETYEYASIGRGSDLIEGPYLALLANMTPADLKPIAKAGSSFWGDGTLARFALVTPTTPPNFAPFPDGEMVFPDALTAPLRAWHKRLGLPRVDLEDVLDTKGQPSGRKIAHVTPCQEEACRFGPGVFDAYNAYHRGLLQLVAQSTIEDLDASYARFAEKALRVAMLLASLENGGLIEMKHWARAQLLAEDWRAGLHALIAQLGEASTTSEKAKIEDKFLAAVKKRPGITAAQAVNWVRPKVDSAEAMRYLDGLVKVGALRGEATRRGTIAYFPIIDPGVTP